MIIAGFSLVATASALYILFARNVLYCALALVCCLMSLAGVYVIYHAEFVAVTQLMVYAGGVIVLMLFGILLTHRSKGVGLQTGRTNTIAGLFLMTAIFSGLTYCFVHTPAGLQIRRETEEVRDLGIALMTDYLLPMEMVAVLLLLVLIGASTVAADIYQRKN